MRWRADAFQRHSLHYHFWDARGAGWTNGSGKTTAAAAVERGIEADARQHATGGFSAHCLLRSESRLDPDVTLRRALAPDSDSVIYQERVIHVAAWAARFFLRRGFESAHWAAFWRRTRAVLIAQLMLQPADVLLLDELPMIWIFPRLRCWKRACWNTAGLVLVTHDRYMLDRVSTVVLGLDGLGGAERFADYSQWEAWQRRSWRREKQPVVETQSPSGSANAEKESLTKKKLSYKETRELDTIEQRIADAERELQAKHDDFLDPAS